MKIAIVGAGFTGLTAAYRLTMLGHQVFVFEQNKLLGGLASGYLKDNWSWPLIGITIIALRMTNPH